MTEPPTPEEFLARVRSQRAPTDAFRLAVEAIHPLSPDHVRRYLPLLLDLARAREES